MGANIAGIYGAQIFRSDDKPKYRRGFTINNAVIATALLLAITRFFDDRVLRKKRRAQALAEGSNESGSEGHSDEKNVADVKPSPVAV